MKGIIMSHDPNYDDYNDFYENEEFLNEEYEVDSDELAHYDPE